MNKIRKYLIHLLGGVTEEELNWSIKYAARWTVASAADAILLLPQRCKNSKAYQNLTDNMKHSRLSNTGKKCKEKKWRIELTEHQLRLMAQCVEDIHRFIGGQTDLINSTVCLEHYLELSNELVKLQSFVTPELRRGASYGWDGGTCPNDNQRKFIAETYYLYREIYHQLTLEAAKHKDMGWNVYLGETLTCNESGEPIKIERIE